MKVDSKPEVMDNSKVELADNKVETIDSIDIHVNSKNWNKPMLR